MFHLHAFLLPITPLPTFPPQPSSSICKEPCDDIRLTQTVQEGLPIPGQLVSNRNSTCNLHSPLPCEGAYFISSGESSGDIFGGSLFCRPQSDGAHWACHIGVSFLCGDHIMSDTPPSPVVSCSVSVEVSFMMGSSLPPVLCVDSSHSRQVLPSVVLPCVWIASTLWSQFCLRRGLLSSPVLPTEGLGDRHDVPPCHEKALTARGGDAIRLWARA